MISLKDRLMKLAERSDVTVSEAESVITAMIDCVEALSTIKNQFLDIGKRQNELLKRGFEKACENWEEATSFEKNFIDFDLAIKALTKLESIVKEMER